MRWTFGAIKTKLKEFWSSIEKILSTLPSSKIIFHESANYHEKRLKNSGYKTKLQQQPKESNPNKKKRKCNVIWFNKPYYHQVSSAERSLVCCSFMNSGRELNHSDEAKSKQEFYLIQQRGSSWLFSSQRSCRSIWNKRISTLFLLEMDQRSCNEVNNLATTTRRLIHILLT